MDKLYIIKVGGNIIDDEKKLQGFLRKYATIEEKKILVHGGGKLATRLAEQLKVPQKVVEGRRITDAETLKIVTMVYAGYINKNIVAALQSNSCNAIGLCGADGDAILAHKRRHPVMDYGFVGDVDMVNTRLITNLLNAHLSPVFAPLTHDQQGQLLNTNADTIAQELAVALSEEYEVILVYLFEKSGVLRDSEDDGSAIPEITKPSYAELKSNKLIFGGMVPKLDNAFTALSKGVSKIIIGKGEELEKLLAGKAGTVIMNE